MFYTTLNRIRENGPCTSGWKKLLESLGKTKADDAPLSLLEILSSNGLDDALWALRCIDDCPEIRLFAVRCVRQVQHLLKDERSLNSLDVSERFAIGEATEEELAAAWAAAVGAAKEAWAAAEEAWAAARAAAEEAWAAAREVEGAAAWGVGVSAREAHKQDFIAIFCSED